ncbi:MAG TPA: cysteine desulfurase family protein [Dissulfurispiraceae bacterium]|nr:cysteine desulfurase family protein [Dissulfurispiraceae bacterium]
MADASGGPIYLDYNATTPHDSEVIAAMWPFVQEHFGNPSNSYGYGLCARSAVRTAREQVAAALSCQADEIFFTGCATESNNWALKGIAYASKNRGNHIITSQVEHPAVIEVCRYLERSGFAITYVPADEYGMVAAADVAAAIIPQTILISVMHANNEVGTIQPVEEIAIIARDRRIVFHSDGAQAVGKIETDMQHLGVDLYTIAGHKIYAPKGVGALYIRKGTMVEKFLHGAGQEMEMRAGTENVPHIVGLGMACEIAVRDLEANMAHLRATADALLAGLSASLEGVLLNGHPDQRLPNTVSASFAGIDANALLAELRAEVAASAGAACHSGGRAISSVLKAMKIPENRAFGTVRFSTGRPTTFNDIDRAVALIASAVKRQREKIPPTCW